MESSWGAAGWHHVGHHGKMIQPSQGGCSWWRAGEHRGGNESW